jgi:hypothetical protein
MENGRDDMARHLSINHRCYLAGVSFYERTPMANTIADIGDNTDGGAADDICGAAFFAKGFEEVATGIKENPRQYFVTGILNNSSTEIISPSHSLPPFCSLPYLQQWHCRQLDVQDHSLLHR